jgi:hypothetical protein
MLLCQIATFIFFIVRQLIELAVIRKRLKVAASLSPPADFQSARR